MRCLAILNITSLIHITAFAVKEARKYQFFVKCTAKHPDYVWLSDEQHLYYNKYSIKGFSHVLNIIIYDIYANY